MPIMLSLILVIAAVLPQAGSSQPATIPQAMARLQAGDAAGARKILETVVAASPADARAWRQLGLVCRQLQDADCAVTAARRAVDLQPANAQMLFDLGVAYALKKDVEAAFEWLAKARAGRKVDMTQMEGMTVLDPLRGDPRFASLVPTAKDFEDPFVEPVAIHREWRGEASNDQFGWIARSIGDVDGDRADDVVTSAPTNASGGPRAGRIYVYSSASGRELWQATGAAQDQLGIGLEAAGDVNGDGAGDVIAGAPGGGYVRIYSGRDGAVLLTLRSEQKGEVFGRHVRGIGDVNADGAPDLIVGAPGAPASSDFEGRAYIFSAKDGSRLLTLKGERAGDQFGAAVSGRTDGKAPIIAVGAPRAGVARAGRTYVYRALSSDPAFVIDADATGTALGGMFLSFPGDLDGDGMPDVYASDWPNAAKGPSTGRIYVHSGKDGRQLLSLTGETAGDGFGSSASVAGDVDGDGVGDLIVGAWQYSGAAIGAGRAYLYSGKTGRLVKTFTCRTPGDTFGFDAVGLGDVNRDGMIDLLITSGWSGVRGFHSGRVFVISSGVRR